MQQEFPNQNAFVELLVSGIEKVIKKSGIEKEKLLGIGAGSARAVDTETALSSPRQ